MELATNQVQGTQADGMEGNPWIQVANITQTVSVRPPKEQSYKQELWQG